MKTFDEWLLQIPGYARSGFNRSLGRQCWNDSRKELEIGHKEGLDILKKDYDQRYEEILKLKEELDLMTATLRDCYETDELHSYISRTEYNGAMELRKKYGFDKGTK